MCHRTDAAVLALAVRGRALLVLALLALGSNAASPAPPDAEVPLELRLKTAFLYNLAKFVDWPPGAFSPDGSLAIGIYGNRVFARAVHDGLDGKEMRGRRVRVRELERLTPDADGCQLVFFDGSCEEQLPQLLAKLSTRAVLTVGECDTFLDRGGIVNFSIEENRIRFDVDPDAAIPCGLKLSSRLLSLARNLRRPRGAR
ncbi:MAG: YfiR family protein [Candidatus Wallbacteria bacterium]|nr:YfiR family protein [Candidatus Wallbacteria bacterium]